MKQIRVFQADNPSDIPVVVEQANNFLAKCKGASHLHITEVGSNAGYSYTITVEYIDLGKIDPTTGGVVRDAD